MVFREPSGVDAERLNSYLSAMNSAISERVEIQPVGSVQVLTAVAEALAKNGGPPGYRVVYRMNAKGEHVVAVIWPPEPS